MLFHEEPVDALIKVESESFEVEVRRLYLPITLEVVCPGCGKTIIRNCRDDHLSYPTFNKPEKVTIMHIENGEECCEFFVMVKLGLTAEVVK